MNILHIDCCALGDNSASRRFTAAAVASLRDADGDARIVYRDLAATPLSHVSGPLLQLLRGQWDEAIPLGAELRAEALQSASLLEELLEADLLVLDAPLYNFYIPSVLKAWLDRLLDALEAGATTGLKQRMAPKRAILITTYCTPPGKHKQQQLMDQHEQQLRLVLGQMGIGQVDVRRCDSDTDWQT